MVTTIPTFTVVAALLGIAGAAHAGVRRGAADTTLRYLPQSGVAGSEIRCVGMSQESASSFAAHLTQTAAVATSGQGTKEISVAYAVADQELEKKVVSHCDAFGGYVKMAPTDNGKETVGNTLDKKDDPEYVVSASEGIPDQSEDDCDAKVTYLPKQGSAGFQVQCYGLSTVSAASMATNLTQSIDSTAVGQGTKEVVITYEAEEVAMKTTFTRVCKASGGYEATQ